jgi:YggT family protein
MFVLRNFIFAVAEVGNYILILYGWILFIRVIVSWVNPDPYNMFYQILLKLTEPVLYPIRRAFPMLSLGIDLSPLIAFAGIYFLRLFLIQTLRDIAAHL